MQLPPLIRLLTLIVCFAEHDENTIYLRVFFIVLRGLKTCSDNFPS